MTKLRSDYVNKTWNAKIDQKKCQKSSETEITREINWQ